MNLKKSKQLRKAVYGDKSLRGERVYEVGASGQRLSTGERYKYRNMKLAKKRSERKKSFKEKLAKNKKED